MFRFYRYAIIGLVASTSIATGLFADSRRGSGEPDWTSGIIKSGEERDALRSVPVTNRPYRPLHFYGNTVRRLHYRGTALPAPRDVVQAGAVTVRRD
jgi:hypothetical protein